MKILCFESAWRADETDELTVRNMLEDLRSSDSIDYKHVYAASKAQMKRMVEQTDASEYDVIYFATHGQHATLNLKKDSIDVFTLADYIDGRYEGKVVYFAACSVMNMNVEELAHLQKQLKARCILGYYVDVDWIQARAMDTVVLQALALYKRPTWMWKFLERAYPDLMSITGLYMYK